MKIIQKFFVVLGYCIFLPHILIIYSPSFSKRWKGEIMSWINVIANSNEYSLKNILFLLRYVPEFRSVLYFRLGGLLKIFLNILARERQLLFINISSHLVGEGLVIQHGHSTIVEADSIGRNCQIWHNVTVGTNKSHSGNKPTIGDNVKICAGAIVIGKISIGNNVTIGAGTVVVKSIPDNSIVVGNPARIING